MTAIVAMIPSLSFDAADHTYRLHDPALPAHTGRILPSVTQVIERAGLVDDAEWFTEESRIRGRLTHRAIMYEETVGLDESSIDPKLQGYITAYRAFKRDVRPGPCELVETPLCDPVLGVAGTPDQVRPLHERLSLLDLKSGTDQRWHGIQTAGYLHLVAQHNPDWQRLPRFCVYLAKDGRYRLVEHKDRHDWPVFRAALTCVLWKGAHS